MSGRRTLGILLPTRGRPGNFERFVRACRETAGDWKMYVRLDTDDPHAGEYDLGGPGISAHHGDRVGFAASLNEMAERAAEDGVSHVGMFGDDVVPESPGWDVALMEALGSSLGVSYGDDGLRRKHAPDLPTHYVTQTDVYRRLGYLAPPGIRHLFLDNVARDIGRHLGNFVFVPVSVRHMHPWKEGEHLHDLTYAEGGRNREVRRSDADAYSRWAADSEWKRRLRP